MPAPVANPDKMHAPARAVISAHALRVDVPAKVSEILGGKSRYAGQGSLEAHGGSSSGDRPMMILAADEATTPSGSAKTEMILISCRLI